MEEFNIDEIVKVKYGNLQIQTDSISGDKEEVDMEPELTALEGRITFIFTDMFNNNTYIVKFSNNEVREYQYKHLIKI